MELLIRDVSRARRIRDELRATEAHLRLIVEQMPAILWTTDANMKITSMVGGGLAAINVEPAELIGMSMLETIGDVKPECTPVSATNSGFPVQSTPAAAESALTAINACGRRA